MRLVEVNGQVGTIQELIVCTVDAVDETRVRPNPSTVWDAIGSWRTVRATLSDGHEGFARKPPVDIFRGWNNMLQEAVLGHAATRLDSKHCSPVVTR